MANTAIGQTNGQSGIETGQVHQAAEYNLASTNRNVSQALAANDAVIQGKKEGPASGLCHNDNLRIAFQLQQFVWKEYGDNGGRLLKESGPLYGLHMAGEWYGRARVTVGGMYKMNFFGGRVNYDGQTQAGIPLKTKTGYLGAEGNADFALRAMPVADFYVKVFAGPAIRFWRRDINSNADASGYVEEWFNFDGRAGAGLDYLFPADFKLFAEGGYKIPFITSENVDWSKFGFGQVSLEPEQTFSPFAEVGLSWKFLFVSGFYDSLRFDKSAVKTKKGYYFYQPESRADIFGVNAGFRGEF
ncbi:MAG: hypothetical protein WC381_10025 [Kiritimatiellia bacterium]